jgi:predicted HAD superfamily Cof-like phosphohydrolase
MTTNAQRIRDFHATMGLPHPDSPVIPDAKTLRLRKTLVREEYEEVMEAFEDLLEGRDSADLTELIHELTDLLYVTYGAITACGVDPDAVFAEVHRANMQKASGPRRADGKVMKPPDFKSADVAAVIAAQQKSP